MTTPSPTAAAALVAEALALAEKARAVGREQGIEQGRHLAEQARYIAQQSKSPQALAAAITQQAYFSQAGGNAPRGYELILQALVYAHRSGDAQQVARAAAIATVIAVHMHATHDVSEFAELARSAAAKCADKLSLFNVHMALANQFSREARFTAAEAELEAAATCAPEPMADVVRLSNLATLAAFHALDLARDRHPEARERAALAVARANAALAAAKASGQNRILARAQQSLALGMVLAGDAAGAVPIAQTAVAASEATGDHVTIVHAAMGLGRAYLALGEADLALESFRKVVSLASTSEHYAFEADAFVELADVYETRGNPREALVALRSALRVKDEIIRTERRQLEEARRIRESVRVPEE